MSVAVVTGSGGLIGSQAVEYFATSFDRVVGIDNDMRAYFFGDEASTRWATDQLTASIATYDYRNVDIRDRSSIEALFAEFGSDIELVVHAASQPSHDWAAREPFTDFDVNAVGTLNLLEATRRHSPDATFVFTSTNKVYGDTPNQLPFVELEYRWELDADHQWYQHGIPEEMSLDDSTHSLFGASKLAADIMCQEYGRYFGMNVGVFRGGCLTGPAHSGTELHGFLAYLMRCVVTGRHYTVFGYKGKQVRDNIHSLDLIRAFDAFHRAPKKGVAYNIGGGRHANCSMLEAIEMCEAVAHRRLSWSYTDESRVGDHIWWIGDSRRFEADYPEWHLTYDIKRIIEGIYEGAAGRWEQEG